MEHAKALGHRNHLQKIRHVEALTQCKESLKKENQKLLAENAKLRANLLSVQEGTVKRLAKGKRDTKDKENVENDPISSKTKGLSADNREPVNRGSPLQTRNVSAP
uniref:Uncharacterized protein n=1 Tax=Lygus hesperus TaxID=30085 RepID=A0A0K8SBR0_LYGHE